VSRILFVVPPLTGHVNPTVGVGAALAAGGHDVAWAGHSAAIGHLLPADAEVLDCGDRFLAEAAGLLPDRERLRGVAALRFLWEDFMAPLARAMVAPVVDAVRSFRPDVVVADQQAFAGPVVADRLGVPWVTSASSPGEFADPLTLVPKVAAWVAATRDALLADLGLPADRIGVFDPRFSLTLTLLYSTEALTGPLVDSPAGAAGAGVDRGPVVPVGPVLGGRPARDDDFPWEWLAAQSSTVLVSLGTLNTAAGERFVRRTVEAVTTLGLSAVVAAPEDLVGPLPPTVLARPSVPQLALLPHVDAVVCHAGHNTVCEALAHGVPLVVAPIRDDQPIVAGQVVRAGAGVRVPFARAGVADIAVAVRTARTDPSYADAAARIAASFADAGGAPRAADLVLAVAAGATVTSGPVAADALPS
jgi:UDP:flavonoid glycosyltransferase YjiC (YdhE family)